MTLDDDHLLPEPDRRRIEQTFGAEVISDVSELRERLQELHTRAGNVGIPLKSSAFELQSPWLSGVIADVIGASDELHALPLENGSKLGKRGRTDLRRLLGRTEHLGDLAEHLLLFDPSTPAATVGRWMSSQLLASLLGPLSNATVDEHAAREIEHASGVAASTAIAEVRKVAEFKALDAGPPSFDEIVVATFGSKPRALKSTDAQSIRTAFGTDPKNLRPLLDRAISHVIDVDRLPDEVLTQAMLDAARLSRAECPALAHRSAALTVRLGDAAHEVDPSATERVISDFMSTEVTRIMQAAQRMDELLATVAREGDTAVLRAHATVSEGMMRPFAGLVLALISIAEGRAPGPARPPLAEAIDQLGASDWEIAGLVVLGASRELRNGTNHENIMTTSAGDLVVMNTDGSVTPVDRDELNFGLLTLRSALTGVDVGSGKAMVAHAVSVEDLGVEISIATAKSIATIAAEEVAGAFATSYSIDQGAATVVLSKKLSASQVLRFARELLVRLPEGVTSVDVRGPRGKSMGRFDRTDVARSLFHEWFG